MKPLQSVCKRTRSRSRSKQTSMLDFGGSGTRRPAPATSASDSAPSNAQAASSKRAASATAAAGHASGNAAVAGGGARKARATSKRGASEDGGRQTERSAKQPARGRPSSRGRPKKRAAAGGRGARPPAVHDSELIVQPKASASHKHKRRRVAKAAAAIATKAAAAVSRKRPQAREEEGPPSMAGAEASNAVPPGPGSKRSKSGQQGKRRETVCLDVTVAAAKPSAKPSAKPKTMELPPPPRGDDQDDASATAPLPRQQSAITPSPAMEKNAAASDGLDSSHGSGRGDEASRGAKNDVATPLKDISDQKKEEDKDVNDNADADAQEERGVAMKASSDSSSTLLSVNRSVTIDPQDFSLVRKENLPPPTQPAAPAFHQPWYQPYTPCFPPNYDATSIPPGVVDIDLLPHYCCPRSLWSHRGCSWLTSRRRCGCVCDSNHCSAEALTEAYLAAYGAERYGGNVGLTGSKAGREEGADDWRAERWWLAQTRKERARLDCHKAEDRRTPSPNCALSDAGSISEPPSGKSLSSWLPRSVAEHLDYLPRQPHITVDMRKILVDWLLEVAEEYKLSTESFWLAVALVDRSLACSYDGGADGKSKAERVEKGGVVGGEMAVQKDKLQLVGCACTLIASKIVEITPPTADDFVYISDKTYTRKEILDMEATVCNALRFRLNFRTPFHYVDRFLRASHTSSESSVSVSSLHSPHDAAADVCGAMNNANAAINVLTKKMVLYLLDLAAMEYKLASKPPGLLAAAAVYLARATLGIRAPRLTTPSSSRTPPLCGADDCHRASGGHWSTTLEYYTGYDAWNLEETVRLLHQLQGTADDNGELTSVFNKHKGGKCWKVALKTVVNEADLGFP